MALKIKQRTKELYALIFYVILYIFIQIIICLKLKILKPVKNYFCLLQSGKNLQKH